MSIFTRLRGVAGALLLLAAGTVSAEPIIFNLAWSGASLGNNARATGVIRFERTLLPNPGGAVFPLPSPAVLNLTVTVTGATAGNGTFVLADFGTVYWDTNGATLDLSRQLVGQPTPELPWGTPTDAMGADAGNGGDFNVFSVPGGGEIDRTPGASRYSAAPDGSVLAPSGVNFFRIATNGGTGDNLILTSFAPGGSSPSFASNVPSTTAWGLIALAILLALAGALATHRLRQR